MTNLNQILLFLSFPTRVVCIFICWLLDVRSYGLVREGSISYQGDVRLGLGLGNEEPLEKHVTV